MSYFKKMRILPKKVLDKFDLRVTDKIYGNSLFEGCVLYLCADTDVYLTNYDIHTKKRMPLSNYMIFNTKENITCYAYINISVFDLSKEEFYEFVKINIDERRIFFKETNTA